MSGNAHKFSFVEAFRSKKRLLIFWGTLPLPFAWGLNLCAHFGLSSFNRFSSRFDWFRGNFPANFEHEDFNEKRAREQLAISGIKFNLEQVSEAKSNLKRTFSGSESRVSGHIFNGRPRKAKSVAKWGAEIDVYLSSTPIWNWTLRENGWLISVLMLFRNYFDGISSSVSNGIGQNSRSAIGLARGL